MIPTTTVEEAHAQKGKGIAAVNTTFVALVRNIAIQTASGHLTVEQWLPLTDHRQLL